MLVKNQKKIYIHFPLNKLSPSRRGSYKDYFSILRVILLYTGTYFNCNVKTYRIG